MKETSLQLDLTSYKRKENKFSSDKATSKTAKNVSEEQPTKLSDIIDVQYKPVKDHTAHRAH